MVDISGLGIAIFFMLGIALFVLIFGVIGIVLKGIALNAMVKRRELEVMTLLCFVPVLQDYVLGAVFDDINEVHKLTSYRYILLVLSIITASFVSVLAIDVMYYSHVSIGFFTILAMLVYKVCKFVILYGVYKEYSPTSAVGLLILSILGLDWVVLFVIRKNEPVAYLE